MVFRFHSLQVTFFCFSQSDFVKKKNFHVKKKKLFVKLNWQPLLYSQTLTTPIKDTPQLTQTIHLYTIVITLNKIELLLLLRLVDWLW